MISVEEAGNLVSEHSSFRDLCRTPIGDAHGLVLHEEIVCTTDSPPFDKAQVDGYAVRCLDMPQPGVILDVMDEVTAGQVPARPVTAGTATRIMTGAPIPPGADAVVMVERTEMVADTADSSANRVRVDDSPRSGQNILRRGESMRSGDVVLRPGHLLRGIEIGLLAELGVTEVQVYRRPTVAIISTGNELVPLDQTPSDGQIRNSNGPMLESLVREAGGQPVSIGIARDTQEDLVASISRGLESDVLLLSGGVSAGILDLVPQVLQQLGVEKVFHKVHLKPGKPLWFGARRREQREHLVFGLPGNPVSSLVCFHLFVRPALAKLAGRSTEIAGIATAKLAVPFRHRGDRPTFFPGRTRRDRNDLVVEPLGWRGSADLRTLVDADALICIHPGDHDLPANSPVTIRWL